MVEEMENDNELMVNIEIWKLIYGERWRDG